MSPRLIICAAEGRSQANRIIGHLINGGFAEDAVSVLFADKKADGNIRKKRRSGASMMATAGVGALLGGAFVWLSGMGVLSVPKLGSLIIAGVPLATAMGRLSHGGVAGALENLGLSKAEADFFETSVGEGKILISVSVAGNFEAIAASRVIRAIGMQSIADTGGCRPPAVNTGTGNIADSILCNLALVASEAN
jgi:hypothetical protein